MTLLENLKGGSLLKRSREAFARAVLRSEGGQTVLDREAQLAGRPPARPVRRRTLLVEDTSEGKLG